MRTLFFGTAAFAIPSLEHLVAQRQQVLLCVTQPDRPQGRGLSRLPSPVKSAAQRLNLPIEEADTLHQLLPRFQSLQPDLGVVISYGTLIPSQLLRVPTHGMLGVHPSLLPKYRGASPIAWAMLNAEPTTGVTVFRLNERVDSGDIALQREVPIGGRETAVTLSERLARLGAELLLEVVQALEHGTVAFRPQDDARATYAPKLTKAQGRVDWQAQAASIDRLVRAMVPWPGAYTEWRGRMVKLWATSWESQNQTSSRRPGEVVSVSLDGVVVAAGEGRLVIHELQLAGRRRMTAQEFLAGHSVRPGEILGSGKGNFENA